MSCLTVSRFLLYLYGTTLPRVERQTGEADTGKIYPVGVDPFHPGSVDPIAEFEDTFEAARVRVP
jgi:hypothetical protein